MTDTDTTGVIHGDAFEALAELPSDYAHASVVDYPWQFKIRTGSGDIENRREPRHKGTGNARDIESDKAMFSMERDEKVDDLLSQLSRVLVDGAWVIFLADDRFQDVVRGALRDSDFTLRRNWAWTPESMGMGSYGRVDHYPMPAATLGDTERYVSDRSTLFRVSGGRQTDYSTGKPVELYRKILRPPVLEDSERLLEPFCGSGPGAAVASERGANYWGADVDADAVNIARGRLRTPRLTGQMTFTDVGPHD